MGQYGEGTMKASLELRILTAELLCTQADALRQERAGVFWVL